MNESAKECIAVIKVKRPKDSEEDSILIKDMNLVSRTIASSLSRTNKEHFAEKSILQDLGMMLVFNVLDAEKIDETTRRELLFPKLMLLGSRDALSKLTVQSISELKSYKRPPPTVFRVIKGVLYVFGKKPKEGIIL